MTRITVLDFGMGNLRSVSKALERVGAEVAVAADVEKDADGIVVPGQGHFGSCVVNLGPRLDRIKEWVAADRPYLGLCLGLQVLFDSSEESPQPGAGIFAGPVVRFGAGLKVPHMGWNEVQPRADSRLFEGIDPGTRFYFVHSYYPAPADPTVVAATSDYGERFCCAAERGNVMATQFHPEKSGEPGLELLGNFVRSCKT